MFVRVKTIKRKRYGYLVENHWTTHGSRQEVTGYIGPCIPLTPISQHTATLLPHHTYQQLITTLVETTLTNHGFTKHHDTLRRDNITIHLPTFTITRNNKNIVLELHNGQLCEHTLINLYHFVPHDNQEDTARTLTETLLAAGVHITGEELALLFEKLHPE